MRILLAEDDEIARRRLTGLLAEWGYEPVCVTTGRAALEALEHEDAPRLLLLDWPMPRGDGLEVCRGVRALPGRPYTYIMLLTQKAARADVIAGFEAGADDYLVKPIEPAELYARLRAGARVIEVQGELIRMREELRRQALYDPLTQILNRRGGMLALDSELGRATRKSTPLAVAIVDLDHFKEVNDTYGHPAGDVVLRQVCKRLAATLRAYDSLSRYGGEEFLIVLPECDVDLARRVIERCRTSIASAPVNADGSAVHVTASFGAWAGHVATDATAQQLIGAADEALYRAKRAGRDRVELVVPGGRPAAGQA